MAAISHGADWDFDLLERYNAEIAKVAAEFGLDTYPNQLEIITSCLLYTSDAADE